MQNAERIFAFQSMKNAECFTKFRSSKQVSTPLTTEGLELVWQLQSEQMEVTVQIITLVFVVAEEVWGINVMQRTGPHPLPHPPDFIRP